MGTRDTSVAVFNQIRENGLLSKRRLQVYQYVFQHGPCTAKQATDALTEMSSLRSDSFRPRFAELEKRGVIEVVGETTCEKTGHKVILWDVTSSLPKKIHESPLQQRLADLGFESLEEYYASDMWAEIKRNWYARHPEAACIISGLGDLQLHHITYERLGCEKDEDLVPLNKYWHKVVHHLVKNRKVKLEEAHLVAKDIFRATNLIEGKY